MDQTQHELFASLRALVEATFPKRCRNCGREYADPAAFIAGTAPIRPGQAGFKAVLDAERHPVLELFRICACGSTLLESFHDRRNESPEGMRRRARFGSLLDKLAASGVDRATARRELLQMINGEQNSLFELIRSLPPQ